MTQPSALLLRKQLAGKLVNLFLQLITVQIITKGKTTRHLAVVLFGELTSLRTVTARDSKNRSCVNYSQTAAVEGYEEG